MVLKLLLNVRELHGQDGQLSRTLARTSCILTSTPTTSCTNRIICKAAEIKAEQNGVKFIEQRSMIADEPSLTFDSRPPRASRNAMLQHFLGQEIQVDKPVFDPSTAILMDFRVDQSKGMHFIYLLPYSPTEALVESTLLAPMSCSEITTRIPSRITSQITTALQSRTSSMKN